MNIHYYPLINKMMTALKLTGGLPLASDSASFSRPWITVARDPGSGGAPIAQLVAEQLGFSFVDKRIVAEIAQSTKTRKAIIKQVDEKSRSKIEDIIHGLLNEEYINDLTYIKELTRVILAYMYQGNVVILGRGANFIGPAAVGLNVHITAPYKIRVQRAMEFEGLNKEDAMKEIKKVEDERRDFVKQYLRRDIDKVNNYDISINTEHLSVKAAASIITEAFYQKNPRFKRYGSLLPR